MIQIYKPNIELFPSYMEFIEDMKSNGDEVWDGIIPKPNETSSDFVTRILLRETSPEIPLVPETQYWAVRNNKVVGRIALRHYLNKFLEGFGGHIGYEVSPSARLQGVAKEMLKLVLETPKAKEIGKLLLTCDPTNLGSNKTILANGGILEKTAFAEFPQRDTNYYWIILK